MRKAVLSLVLLPALLGGCAVVQQQIAPHDSDVATDQQAAAFFKGLELYSKGDINSAANQLSISAWFAFMNLMVRALA